MQKPNEVTPVSMIQEKRFRFEIWTDESRRMDFCGWETFDHSRFLDDREARMFKGLRTAQIIAKGLLSPRRNTSLLSYRVGVSDCDFNRHLTNSKYPMYMDFGRWDLMIRTGAIQVCMAKRLTPVVVEMNLKYKRELPYGTSFKVDTRIVKVDHRIMVFEQLFLVNEKPCFYAEVHSLVLHRSKVTTAHEFKPFVVESHPLF